MKVIYNSLLFIFFFALLSCSDTKVGECPDDPPNPTDPPVGTVSGTRFLNAVAPLITEETRVTVKYGPSFTWDDQDRISVSYYADGVLDPEVANRKYSIMKEYAGLSAAVFEAESKLEFSTEAASHTLIAVYPFSDELSDPSRFTVNIPSIQEPLDVHNMKYTMFSRMDYTEEPETVLMGFDLFTSFVMFHLDASGTDITSIDIEKLKIKGSSGEILAGTSTYELFSSLSSPSNISESSTDIEITFNEKRTLSEPLEFAFLALPQEHIILSVEFESEFYEVSLEYSMENGISTDTFNQVRINLSEMISDGSATVTYTGPVAQSNSYIALPGGVVRIPVGRAYDVWKEYLDTDLTGAHAAELIWEDNKGLITGISIDTDNFDKNSQIVVSTSGSKEGNAVVGLKFNDIVKWSWHLWIVDYDPDVKTHSLNGHEFMSRNLGAVNEDPTGFPLNYGLVYQWGRKDPFTGAAEQEIIDATARPMYNKDGNEIDPEALTSYDLATLLENPTGFGNTILYYGSAEEDSWGNETGKTVFDPCPEGWRVPSTDEGVHPWTDFDQYSEYMSMDANYNYTRGYMTNDGIWYPASGERRPDSMTNDFSYFTWQGAYGCYWIASANRTTAYTVYGRYLKFDVNGVDYDLDTYLYYGFPVRCERE